MLELSLTQVSERFQCLAVAEPAVDATDLVATGAGAGAGDAAGAGAGALVGAAAAAAGAAAASAAGLPAAASLAALPTPLLAPSPPLRKSVTYQPAPLSWKPAAVTCLVNAEAPQAGQTVSGSSEIFCSASLV